MADTGRWVCEAGCPEPISSCEHVGEGLLGSGWLPSAQAGPFLAVHEDYRRRHAVDALPLGDRIVGQGLRLLVGWGSSGPAPLRYSCQYASARLML